VIVEDYVLIQENIRLVLESDCDVVATAEDGETALAAVTEFQPDVITLDVVRGATRFSSTNRVQVWLTELSGVSSENGRNEKDHAISRESRRRRQRQLRRGAGLRSRNPLSSPSKACRSERVHRRLARVLGGRMGQRKSVFRCHGAAQASKINPRFALVRRPPRKSYRTATSEMSAHFTQSAPICPNLDDET
jgi:hypothetical protein